MPLTKVGGNVGRGSPLPGPYEDRHVGKGSLEYLSAVVPPYMMTRPLGAIPAIVPRGETPSRWLDAPFPARLSPLPFELPE